MAKPLPSGTVAFLMSDIEGSTRMAAALGAAFTRLLDEHFGLIDEAVAQHGGTVVSTEGDSVFAVFPSAREAVAAAIAAQRALSTHEWPAGGRITVRIGIHAGEAESRGGGYAGLEVHRTARIMAAAWGGEILVSDAARALTGDALPQGASFRDLGAHRLKDFPRPQQIHQLLAPDLRADFPPPRTASEQAPTNLPAALTRFVGRTRELEELRKLVGADRLVTLTGPGGTGKTRLGIEAARSVLDRFPDGVWFVALDAVRDPALVMPTIAQTLDLPEPPGRSIPDVVRERLRQERTLLVLDNLEQILEAAPEIARLLHGTTDVCILASSREPLMVGGERIYPVPPLDVPAERGHPRAADLRGSSSIELFVERARAVRPDFALTDDNAAAVAAICRRLDGLPLAIELASARLNVLAPEQILSRLERRLNLLASQRRDLPERQRTLRGAIDWSHDLLSEPERALFRRFSVFVGGADLEAVEAVVDPARELGADVLDLAAALVDRSLVRSTDEGGEARLSMLETIREYASERLAAAGEAREVEARHAAYYLAVAEAAAVPMPDARRNVVFARLDRELGNLRAVIRWSLETRETDIGLRLATALNEFWHVRNHLGEGIGALEDLIGASAEQGSTTLRARALTVAGGLLTWQADAVRSRSLSEQGLAMAEGLGDVATVAMAKDALAWSTFFSDPEQALDAFEEAADAARAVGDDALVVETVGGQAWASLRLGHLDDARRFALEVITLGERMGAEYMTAFSLVVCGMVDGIRGDVDAALRQYGEALHRAHAAGGVVGLALSLDAFAAAALERGDAARGVRLAAAADRLRRESGGVVTLTALGRDEPLVRARSMIDPSQYELAVEQGRALSTDEAVAMALDDLAGRADLMDTDLDADARAGGRTED